MDSIKGIDKQFYDLLINLNHSINLLYLQTFDPKFTPEYVKSQMKIIADAIFLKPYEKYKREHDLKGFLIDKTSGVPQFYHFFDEIFGYWEPMKYHSVLYMFEQLIFKGFDGLLKEIYASASAEVLEAIKYKIRDHIIHQFNTFLIGVFLYLKSSFIKECYDQMLENRNYKGEEGASFRGMSVDAQFLEQWFITAATHDLGLIFEKVYQFTMSYEVIDQYTKSIKDIQDLRPIPQVDLMRMRLDVGKLFEINFEVYDYEVGLDIYEEALSHLDKLENKYLDYCFSKNQPYKPEHGIICGKLLLKMFNVANKLYEKDAKLHQRFAMRNYISPVETIALHNLIINRVVTEPISCYRIKNTMDQGIDSSIISNWPEKKVFIRKNAFKDEFLLTMLVACDESANFDRIDIDETNGSLKEADIEVGHKHELKLEGLEGDSDQIVIIREPMRQGVGNIEKMVTFL